MIQSGHVVPYRSYQEEVEHGLWLVTVERGGSIVREWKDGLTAGDSKCVERYKVRKNSNGVRSTLDRGNESTLDRKKRVERNLKTRL